MNHPSPLDRTLEFIRRRRTTGVPPLYLTPTEVGDTPQLPKNAKRTQSHPPPSSLMPPFRETNPISARPICETNPIYRRDPQSTNYQQRTTNYFLRNEPNLPPQQPKNAKRTQSQHGHYAKRTQSWYPRHPPGPTLPPNMRNEPNFHPAHNPKCRSEAEIRLWRPETNPISSPGRLAGAGPALRSTGRRPP